MKFSRLAGMMLMLAALASCNNEDVIPDADQTSDDKSSRVMLSASVGNTDASADSGTTPLPEGATVAVSAGDQAVVNYTLTDGAWTPEGGNYLNWKGQTSLPFKAFYPVDPTDAIRDVAHFKAPTDQSQSVADYCAADYMTFSGDVAKAEQIELMLGRRMARVIIAISALTDEFTQPSAVEITDVKIKGYSVIDNNQSTTLVDFTPFVTAPQEGNTVVGTTYTVLVAPNAQDIAGEAFVTLTVNGTQRTVKGIKAAEAGCSYLYNLSVGKKVVKVTSFTAVEDGDRGLSPTFGVNMDKVDDGGAGMSPTYNFGFTQVEEGGNGVTPAV